MALLHPISKALVDLRALAEDDIASLADTIVEEAAESKDFHESVRVLLKVLRQCAEKKSLVKHVTISYHDGGGDSLQLIFDDDPTLPATYENLIRARTIKLTDSGGTGEEVKYEGDLEIFAHYEEGLGKMALRFPAGGTYVFSTRYSIVNWARRGRVDSAKVQVTLGW